MKKERRGKEDGNLSKSDLLRGLFKAIYVTINTFVFNFDEFRKYCCSIGHQISSILYRLN